MSFGAIFDRVFKVRYVRGIALPSFWRSVLMSSLSLIVLGALWVWNKETLTRGLRFGDPVAALSPQLTRLGLLYGGATIITNWIPDYLSLVQSRWVIGRIEATKSPLLRVPWFLADIVLTLSISMFAIYLGGQLLLPFVADRMMIEIGCFTPDTFTLGAAWQIFVAGLTFETPPATLNYDAAGIYIYSTFITSVWLWLHIASRGAEQVAAVMFPSARRFATRGLFLFGGIVLVCLTFWSVQFSDRYRDVRVVYGAELADEGERVVRSLRDAGLTVTTTDQKASIVIIVDASWRRHPVWGSLDDEVDCGARRRSTILHHRPGERIEPLVNRVIHANSLLPQDQLAVCRARAGLPAQPACRSR